MTEILLVEDDPTLGLSLQVALQSRGHGVTLHTTVAGASAWLDAHTPDLVVLDLGLPDGDGLTLCREMRDRGSIAPILILTARGTLEARVDGLTAGADDYLTKPFELPELLARVEARLRRARWHGPGEKVKLGALEVDFRRRVATHDGESVPMTELELKLLRYLLDKAGQPVSREELLTRVWGLSAQTRTRTVDVFISRLRRVIERDTRRPQHLLNVRGVGYRLVVDPGAA